jgi:hypothetical protein
MWARSAWAGGDAGAELSFGLSGFSFGSDILVPPPMETGQWMDCQTGKSFAGGWAGPVAQGDSQAARPVERRE